MLEKVLEALRSIVERLDEVCSKLAEVVEGQRELVERLKMGEVPKALDVLSLLELPDHLRKTAMALAKMGEGTAEDVARATGRERAVESAYLNQLARMGYVKKRRVGRKVVFSARGSP